MEAMPQRWTDDRMDDLGAKVDRVDADVRRLGVETSNESTALRGEMRGEFAAVRKEMREGFDKVDERFDKVDTRFEKIDERFDRVHERFDRFYGVLVRTCVAAIGLLAALVTVIGIQA